MNSSVDSATGPPPLVSRPVEDGRADELLLMFVHDRSVPCPRCGYDLRALTQPRCPECREPLKLVVGRAHVQHLWFLLTIAPGIFSGILSILMVGVVVWQYIQP